LQINSKTSRIMVLESKVNKEYHANGMLAYIETISIVSDASAYLYPNRRIHPNGYSWIRTGLNQKFFDNGQLSWELQYDDLGTLIKTDNKQYRKDGTTVFF